MTDTGTRERILETAGRVFVDKGYENTTIRDICSEAGANVAAINYYFGDKHRLYIMVLAKWMEDFVVRYDRTEGTSPASSPEERLRAYIRADLKCLRLYDEPSRLIMRRLRLVLREMTDDDHEPEVFKCLKKMNKSVLYPIVADLLGLDVGEILVEQTSKVITGLLTHYFIAVIQDSGEGLKSESELERLTGSLTLFALGGLNAIREQGAG
jgi:TetR/AcrR family transcriptional regulator, regulator of cefoperazone and chloramphenicol sensitivity